MFLDQQRNVELSQAVTANLIVTRAAFDSIGGFDPSLPSGGDYDFVRRAVGAGMRLVYCATAVVHHPTLDDRRAFLRKVWTTNRWSAARHARNRHARNREPLDPAAIVTFVPFVGAAVARHRALRPALRLCRARIESAGARLSRGGELGAIALLYFVVCYVAGIGRVQGWLEGMRMARRRDRHGGAPPP
jgi:GT2 family glycosyltransferase